MLLRLKIIAPTENPISNVGTGNPTYYCEIHTLYKMLFIGTMQIWNTISARFQRPCFWCRLVQRHSQSSADIRKLRWQLEISSGYNFDLEQDIDAIPTANPAFSMSPARKPHTPTSFGSFSNRTYFRFRCHYLSSGPAVSVAMCRSLRHSLRRYRKCTINRWNRVEILFQTKSYNHIRSLTAIFVFCCRSIWQSVGLRGIQLATSKTWV
jgi:hypothetical protein